MKAKDFCDKVFDGTHDTPKPVSNGKLLITSKHIANRCLDTTSAYYISEDDYNNINKRSRVQQYDVLFSMIGTVGNVYIERSKNIDYAIKNMGVFSCGDRDRALWLYYYLQSPKVKMIINSYLSGAVQKFVPLDFLRNLDIPDYSRQCKSIINVLTALDDQIALNKRINDKLEAMAKRLYDYWFVQFDFPDENGRPYKSSGGKMVWNETLKREIPAGWEVKRLGDVFEVINNKIQANCVTDSDKYTPIEVIPRRQMSFYESVSLDNAMSGLCRYNCKDILLSNRRVYFHKVCIAPFCGITRDTVIILRSKQADEIAYNYQLVNADQFIDYATLHSYGSEQPVLSWQSVLEYKIPNPSKNLLKLYCKKINALINIVIRKQEETSRLTALRDRLLPLLMNGQVVVEGEV